MCIAQRLAAGEGAMGRGSRTDRRAVGAGGWGGGVVEDDDEREGRRRRGQWGWGDRFYINDPPNANYERVKDSNYLRDERASERPAWGLRVT